ncbi:MAG: ABC transporter permease [Gammaproteobacteria bacterium]|nr:ABC transporter permease [Gammaproteobacteria bacterium]
MTPAVLSIARFTLLEGRRTQLPALVLALLSGAGLLAVFAASLAITDSTSYRVGVYAGSARLGLVLLVSLFVAASVAREFEDRMLDLTLSRPVSRAAWYGGRLAGFVAIALVCAALAALPLLVGVAVAPVMAWGATLAAELGIVAAVSLTCAVTLRQVTAVVAVTLAFYLLARAIDALVLMSHGPTVDPASWVSLVVGKGIDLLALVIPPLGRFADSGWLMTDGQLPALAGVGGEALAFVALVAAVGLFDLYRMND